MKGTKTGGIGIVVMLVALAIGGCGFLTGKPDKPEQILTLEAIELAGRAGCTLAQKQWPTEAAGARRILVEQVLPQLDDQIAAAGLGGTGGGTGVVRTLDAGAGGGGSAAGWETWIGPALALAKFYAQQYEVLDTSATYYKAVKAAVTGCVAGIDLVLPAVA